MAMTTVSTPTPVGDTWRSLGASWYNAENIAYEDFMRDVQKTQYAHNLDLETLALQNQFNAEEAQKNRDFQMQMSNSQYQRAVQDLKKAGLNPILAYQNLGASVPQGSQASTGSGGSAYVSNSKGFRSDTTGFASAVASIALGIAKISAGIYNTKHKPAPVTNKYYSTNNNYYRK